MAEPLKDDTAFVSNKEDSLQHEQYALDAKDYKCILLLLQAVYFVDDKHFNVLIGARRARTHHTQQGKTLQRLPAAQMASSQEAMHP